MVGMQYFNPPEAGGRSRWTPFSDSTPKSQQIHLMNSTSTQERGGSKGPSHRDSEESVSHPRAERYWYGRC